jgi:hypothetical protein
MLKLLYTYIKSLFIPTDITLILNGSQLTFTKEGDIKLAASRSVITKGKYIFLNGNQKDINNIMFNKGEICLEQLDLETL